jgi:exodeoxyribonuclease X
MTVRIIDVETTGTDAEKDQIVEIASCDLTRELGVTNFIEHLCKPGIPIPPQASAVHHIVDDDVKDKPSLVNVIDDFQKADAYVAHNAAFEKSFLDAVLGYPTWVCTFKCALRIWPELPSHSNQFLRYHLGLVEPFGIGRKSLPSHRALSDTIVTAAILVEMMQSTTWAQLVDWSSQPALFTVLSFGKHVGMRYDAAPIDYLDWIIGKSDMSEDVKSSARHWRAQRYAGAA